MKLAKNSQLHTSQDASAKRVTVRKSTVNVFKWVWFAYLAFVNAVIAKTTFKSEDW